ncbi:MAG: alanine dehydrogenase [Desulfovibrionales bacterium]|nr:alanine dehydrogenase [Desulfovibrionales bacterium]
MIVGVLKEIKAQENRVCMTPSGVEVLKQNGHTVLVETAAGVGSNFSDDQYKAAGATIVSTPAEVYAKSDMVMHVKEPLPSEYGMVRPGQIVFTYFHFAADEKLTREFMKTGSVSIAYETVTGPNGMGLPLLTPMSEVAGRMAAQEAAKYNERVHGGRGILLGGVTGVAPATVLVLGGGIVGTNAALMAAGLGARVFILDMNLDRLRYLSEVMPKNVTPLMSSPSVVRELSKQADAIIGAVLVVGAKAPKLVTRAMLKDMKPGCVMVDVAIDQGGCFETSKPTTHSDPVYEVDGIIHYCVANMPGGVPSTSTMALTNATLPYAVQIANKGWKQACLDSPGLKNGLNMVGDKITFKGVSDAFGLPYTPADSVL